MRKALTGLVLFSLLILLPFFASAATINAASCSQQDVKNAINSASDGDTIMVPEGSCVWISGSRFISGGMYVYPSFGINKSIMLQGAGAGKTVITCMTNFNYTIIYKPANTSGNLPFRVTGFTFDMANQSYGIVVSATHSSDLTVQNKIRIDHNIFANVPGYNQAILVNGMRGVVDNNVFENIIYPMRGASSYGNGKEWWDAWDGIIFGAANNNMYFEDNVFNGTTVVSDCQYANRYAYRYNTITTASDSYPLFDMHGNQGEGYMYSCFGGEMYGNLINAGSYAVDLLDHRGGKAVIFDNYVNTSYTSWIQVREEYDDARNPTTNPQPQHVSDSYYWNNYERDMTPVRASVPIGLSGTATGGGNNYLDDSSANFPSAYANPIRYGLEIVGGTGAGQHRLIISATPTRLTVTPNWTVNPDVTSQYRVLSDCCDAIAENSEFYNQNTSFNGMSGIGCGPLFSRPVTCTPSVGYWATDQPCDRVDADNVGANPKIPISGTLYKCTAPNTWTAYYTPYTYPHPIRTDCVNYPGLCDSGAVETCNQYKRINATTLQVCSCSYEDVQAAVSTAQEGDIVLVPAGNCTWTNTLTVTKGVAIIGSGVGNTIIDKTTAGDILYYLIPNPSVYSFFRLSGIEFDLNDIARGPFIHNPSPYHEPRIRIDHNYFLNCAEHSWRLEGQVYGVVDSNTFTGNVWERRYGSNDVSWNNIAYSYGGEAVLFFEDNIIQTKYDGLNQLGLGSILVERYNTINYIPGASSNFYPWDSHGNQDWGSNDAAMGREIYGNIIDANGKNVKLFYHRGGMAILFWNKMVDSGSAWITLQEECDDCYYGHTCATCDPEPSCSPNGQPQHVSDSYYWNNRFGASGTNLVTDITIYNSDSDCTVRNYLIAEDVDVFWQKPSFNGTSGVGCGTLSEMNAISNCLEGIGFWVTNQSCSSINDNNVGANPVSPISGTLYKCGSNHNWVAYYTPFTYPHPIRTDCANYPALCDSGSTPPVAVPGDINGDGVVSIPDLSAIGVDFGKRANLNFARSDTNDDGVIDIFDMVFVASRFA